MTTRGIGRKTAAFQFVYGTLHCSSLRGGVLLDQTQDPDYGQLVQEAGLRSFVWRLANHSSPIGGSVKLTMSLLNIIIPVSSTATSSTLSTLRSSTWAVRMASQLDCSFNSQGGWFVCLFVKCFGNPHSGESEVIYLHVLPQSTTKGGCQCISLNRKVPLTPIFPLQYTKEKPFDLDRITPHYSWE